MSDRRSRDLGEITIALFKLVKAVLLLLLAAAAFSLIHRDPQEVLWHRIEQLGLDPGNHLIHRLLYEAGFITTKKLEEFGVGFLAYAAVFATEGIGLLMRKRWAEYLTVIVTASFLPFEFIGIAHHTCHLKAIVIGVNIATVIYLVLRIRKPLGS